MTQTFLYVIQLEDGGRQHLLQFKMENKRKSHLEILIRLQEKNMEGISKKNFIYPVKVKQLYEMKREYKELTGKDYVKIEGARNAKF